MLDGGKSLWMAMAKLLLPNLGRLRHCVKAPEGRLDIDFDSGTQYVSLLRPGNSEKDLMLSNNSFF